MKNNFFLLFIVLIFFSCKNDTVVSTENQNINIPYFNSDSAFKFIEDQVSFGPRNLSSPGATLCLNYLKNKISKYADNIIIQTSKTKTYDNVEHEFFNIIGEFNPENKDRILLCAHWDTRHIAENDPLNKNKPILGANDGGSGVGVLLEIARIIQNNPITIGLDIILFDAEDHGNEGDINSWCLGSQYWSKTPHKKNYYAKYGVLLDMVGGENANFTIEGGSYKYAENYVKKIWNKGNEIGYGDYFVYDKTEEIIDDHFFINRIIGIPTLNIVEYDYRTKSKFNEHWHTHNDNMNIISQKTLQAVGETLINIIYNEK
tara:strand:+ start:8668 stop:9618 length:951 start_codon:yes stop_codon:yes gene_type:complete